MRLYSDNTATACPEVLAAIVEATDGLARAIDAHAAATRPLGPVEANEIFVRLAAVEKAVLRAQGFELYDWGAADAGAARLVVSWDQDEGDVERLCRALRGVVAG